MRLSRIRLLVPLLLAGLAMTASFASAQAPAPPTYVLKTTIPVPTWAGLDTIAIDINWVDPATQTLYIASRPPGGAIEVIDAANNTFVRAAGRGQFLGVSAAGNGPNGVASVSPVEVAAGNGDSTIKLINVYTDETQSINTGGTTRADELGYDPISDTIMVGNNRENPQFVTILKAHPFQILGKITFPAGLGQVDQPVAVGGKFYVSVASSAANPGGEVDVIDPNTLTIERVIPAGNCRPSGMAAGVPGTLITGGAGCVIDIASGRITQIPDAGGDEVDADPVRGVYAFEIVETGTLNLADARTNQVFQKLPVGPGGHNVAVNPVNGEIFVPDLDNKV
ncbi:MAG: hypothetical protein QOF51_3120, partial [Chloroflexota bacterium]|nr:hypothetical protein [Chloroflexota bacterium]